MPGSSIHLIAIDVYNEIFLRGLCDKRRDRLLWTLRTKFFQSSNSFISFSLFSSTNIEKDLIYSEHNVTSTHNVPSSFISMLKRI